MNKEFAMSQSLDNLRNQIGPQLDLTLRIIQANGVFAEKVVAWACPEFCVNGV